MHFFIMGGTGFIGEFLLRYLLEQGHSIEALSRPGSSLPFEHPDLDRVEGNALDAGPWQERAGTAQVVVNLVGSSIMTRWTEDAKERIRKTRFLSTDRAVEALGREGGKTFFCANAVGYYGDGGDSTLTEDSPPGKGFLAEVCLKWQARAEKAREGGHRVVVGRFAPVLGPGGGALEQMLTPFKLGVGGKIGSGKQWFPWIHVLDLVRFVGYAAGHEHIEGPVNVCAPDVVTNQVFTKTLGDVLNRPTLLTVPSFAVKLACGEAAQSVLGSTRAVPQRLLEEAFHFEHPNLKEALEDILQG